jgi:hypothetical protein
LKTAEENLRGLDPAIQRKILGVIAAMLYKL